MPERADAYGLMGFCLFHLGEQDRAVDAYKKSIEINPDFFWFHYNLGVLYFKKGQYDEARESLNRALEQEPTDVMDVIYDSKRLYLPLMGKRLDQNKIQMVDFVKQGFQKAIDLIIASSYFSQDYAKLFSYSKAAIQAQQKNQDYYHFYAGYALYEKGEFTGAIPFFQRAIQLNPSLAESYQYLGLSFEALGQVVPAQVFKIQAQQLLDRQGSTVWTQDQFTIELF
jgi:superkiller protein 3